MIRSVTVTNYLGRSLKLELAQPEKSGFIIKEITGLGPATANINVTELSTNDGGLFNSARVEMRNIVMKLEFLAMPTVEDVRQQSYQYFPLKRKVTLRVETDNRISEIDGYVESNEPDIFSKNESTKISIVCPDPYFKSTNFHQTVFYGVDSLFEFPFSNESVNENLIELGRLNNSTEQTIFYDGDSEVGIVINLEAYGDVSGFQIHNVTTKEKMILLDDKLQKLTGSGIVYGDKISISTIKGEKSIVLTRNGVRKNILNCLDRNSDWFQLSKGDNIFAYVAEGVSYLQLKIENKIIYEGI